MNMFFCNYYYFYQYNTVGHEKNVKVIACECVYLQQMFTEAVEFSVQFGLLLLLTLALEGTEQ